MTVRNFWIEGDIDGRKAPLKGGPKSKDGGFDLEVLIRDKGSSKRAVFIRGIACKDGTLKVEVEDDRSLIYTVRTER